MAAIESLGIGSDLLTSDLVESIINADKAAGELRFDTQQNIIDAKISAYGDVQSKLYDFSEAIVALSDSSNVGATLATSSDETILTATAESSAPVGTYSVDVQRVAAAHSLVSDSYTATSDTIGTVGSTLTFTLGTFTYAGGFIDTFSANPDTSTKTITLEAGNNTLQGLRDAINDDQSGVPGVKASLIYDGTGYVMQLTSEDTGEDFAMEIVAKDAFGALATSGVSGFAYNKNQDTPGTNLTQTQEGEDALLSVNGLNVTRSSNEVTELIDGVTLNLKSADAGTSISIDVSSDITGISENIQDMIDSYNEFQSLYQDLTNFNVDDSVGSLLLGDSTLRGINNQIKSIMTSTVANITATNFRSLSELGIYSDQTDSFKLKFDATLFAKGIGEDPESVAGVFSEQGLTTDPNITFLNESVNTHAGTYDLVLTQLATHGDYEGGTVDLLDFIAPVVINDANDQFTINVNGTSSAITLTQGSYATGASLATELQLQINSNEKFKERAYAVSVEHDSANKSFNITSNAYGSSSQVSFSSVDTNTANTLGFTSAGDGEFKGVPLTTLNSTYLNGYGTSTVPSTQIIDSTDGINFSSSNATFSISLNGGAAEAVTVNLNADGLDLNSDGIFGDRKDTLQAIQTAVDATALNGSVTASFNNEDKLVFTTSTPSVTDSIEITAVGATTSDILLGLKATDGPQINGKDPGLTFGSIVDFEVVLNGTTSANTVNLPAATYATGDDLATALALAINTDIRDAADANLAPFILGATTSEGTRDISTDINFTGANSGFVLNVNGVEKNIIMDGTYDTADNIADLNSELDDQFGVGVVTASLGAGNGLQLTTDTTGHGEYIQVIGDGRGAFTTGGAAIAGGIDFSGANNATFDIEVDGITLSVDVNTNASGGDNTDSLAAIQSAIDLSILNSGQFEVGDVVAKLESGTNQLVIESVARNGIKTAAMFGANAQLDIKNTDANAQATLGLPVVDTAYIAGYDAFGMGNDITFGSDITADVRYEYDSTSDKGQLIFNIGGHDNTVAFANLNASAISFLGMHEPNGTEDDVITGLDVAGTINGVDAKGSGQYLTGLNGNVSATNGYYVSSIQSAIQTPPLIIDATNDTFTIELDGFEAVISVEQGTYITGAALADKIQTAINDNVAIDAENLSVKVDFTDDVASSAYGTIGIISTSTGTGSSVLMKDVSNEASAAYGFVAGQGVGEVGQEKDGDIDVASGIRVKVTGGDLGERGSVTYISGIADQLKDLLQNFLDPTKGILATKFETLDTQNETLKEDRESFDARVSATEARLKSQFLYNDAIIATLKTTENFLTQQFEAMAKAK